MSSQWLHHDPVEALLALPSSNLSHFVSPWGSGAARIWGTSQYLGRSTLGGGEPAEVVGVGVNSYVCEIFAIVIGIILRHSCCLPENFKGMGGRDQIEMGRIAFNSFNTSSTHFESLLSSSSI